MRLCCALVLLAACTDSSYRTMMPGQKVAAYLVWTETFGAPGDPPPVEWTFGYCNDSDITGVGWDGGCFSELCFNGLWKRVAWRSSFHASSYAHGLEHGDQARRGISDPNHERAADWAMVGVATEKLIAAGL